MNALMLDDCILENDLIANANQIILDAQVKLKEKLLIFNSKKETEYHSCKSKLNRNGNFCKKN